VRGDDREYEAPALADEILVNVRIARADLCGNPTKIELDRPADTVLEVDEERPLLRVEHVPRVGLAVQQLLGGAPVDDRPLQTPERVDEKLPILVCEIRSDVGTCNPTLNVCGSIREVRCLDIDLAHGVVKTLERVRVVVRRKLSRLDRLVVGQHGDVEAVSHEDAWLDSRFQHSDGAVGLREPSNDFKFSLCAHRCREDSIANWRDPGDDIAWRQADDKSVGVAQDDCVIDSQAERRCGRHRRNARTSPLRCLHLRVASRLRSRRTPRARVREAQHATRLLMG
jgi:hypothetical protein